MVPKKPFVNILDGDAEILGYMMKIAQKISRVLVKQNLGSGVNIIMNNGAEAGQEVFHAHIHVIPRLEKDQAFAKPKYIKCSIDTTNEITALLKTGLAK